MPELNVTSLQDRSQPVALMGREDSRSEAIKKFVDRTTDDDWGSWLLGLDKLVKVGADSPDPIRRYDYEVDEQSEKVFVIAADDGTITDPIAEFKAYAKDAGDEYMSLSAAPQSLNMMRASLEGKLFIRPRGEKTYRQVQSRLDLTDPENPTIKMSLSTPVEKLPREEPNDPAMQEESIQGSVATMAEPEKPSIWKRIFAVFYREELAEYEHQMEIYRAHQTLEALKDQTLQQARDAMQEYQRVQQEEQSRALDKVDEELHVELSNEALKKEAEEYDREMIQNSYGGFTDRTNVDPKQQKIDQYNERFPGMYDQREKIIEERENLSTEKNQLSAKGYVCLAFLLLPEGEELDGPDYLDALFDSEAYGDEIDWNNLEILYTRGTKLYEAATACVRNSLELASKYSMGSKEFRLLATAGHEVMQAARQKHSENKGNKEPPFDVNEFEVAEGMYQAAMLYEEGLKAKETLYTRILDNSGDGEWSKRQNLSVCGHALGMMVMSTFTDAIIRLNQGEKSLNHVLKGLSQTNASAYADALAEGPLIQNILKEGPKAVAALINDPQKLRKFAIEGMTELNKRQHNTVADINLMKREESVVVRLDRDGRPEKQPEVKFL